MSRVCAVAMAVGWMLAASAAVAQSERPAHSTPLDEARKAVESEESKQSGGSAGSGESQPSEASGDSTTVTKCQYHTDCPSGMVCLRGVCIDNAEALSLQAFAADDACGADRRCRIERLERLNRARRRARRLKEKKFAESRIDEYEQKKLEENPRLDRPLAVDLRASRLGVLGLAAGYTLFSHLRPELQFVHFNSYVSQRKDGRDYSGEQPVSFLMPGLSWYFIEGDFSPFVTASFVYAFGKFTQSTFNPSTGNTVDRKLQTKYHAVELKGGVDYQLEGAGFHMRLGLAYRPLIYSQARLGPGNYSEAGRGALTNWYKKMVRLDLVLLAGWAF